MKTQLLFSFVIIIIIIIIVIIIIITIIIITIIINNKTSVLKKLATVGCSNLVQMDRAVFQP